MCCILGEAYNHLWDYEVVELFFLSSTTGLYLEVEFGPHGQHLGLLLNKRKECLSHSFPLEYQAELLEGIHNNTLTTTFYYTLLLFIRKWTVERNRQDTFRILSSQGGPIQCLLHTWNRT